MIKAVIYARVSTLDQSSDEKVSIPDQIKWAKDFCESRKWQLVKEYIEPGVTGDTETEDRKAFSKLLEDAKNNLFDIVLVYHSSRLAREADIGMKACRLLGQMRKQVYFRNSPVEPMNPSEFYWGTNIGAMYMNAFAFVGDLQENVARSERVRSGAIGLAKRGVLRNAPFGYIKVPKFVSDGDGKQKYTWSFESDPIKASVVKDIFDSYAKTGGSLRHLVLKLNKENITAPSGKTGPEAWSAATIKNILSNPAYTGKVRWGRKLGSKYKEGKTSNGKSRRIYTPADKWILTKGENFKGFIGEKTFESVQEKLKSRGLLKGRAVASPGLLTGKVVCGFCGKKAYHKTRYVKKRDKKYLRSDYTCQSYIRFKTCRRHIIAAKKLHDIVTGEISQIATNPKFRKRILDEYEPSIESSIRKLDIAGGKVLSLEKKSKRILEAYENGIIDLDTLAERKKSLDQDIIKAKQELDNLRSNTRLNEQFKENAMKFKGYTANFRKRFERSDFKTRKELLSRLIDNIVVKDGTIRINYAV